MDIENEINSLAAETLALQTLFVELCRGLIVMSPQGRSTIARVFDHAADITEHIAIKHGKSASPEHTVKALGIVEKLRTAVLGDQQKPSL
jgi:hypothetical protein